MSAYVFADTLRRWLEYCGYKVKQVINITDVGHLTSDADEGEDRMEIAARREQQDPWQIAQRYTELWLQDMDKLNIRRPHVLCRATDHIPDQIELIRRLESAGYTYVISDGVYYDISKFPSYGKLSGQVISQLEAGARVVVNAEKRNPQDFALWKFCGPEHIMQWDSPWGRGYPGWHIECSAMGMKYLGESFDIHSGGEDHLFPHHECEIAQAEGATGKPFVKYWMHKRFITIDEKRIGKSEGNAILLAELEEKGFDPLAYRLWLLQGHYRARINFTEDALAAAQTALESLRELARTASPETDDVELEQHVAECLGQMTQAMNDDLNTPEALAALFAFKPRAFSAASGPGRRALGLLEKFDAVLGLNLLAARNQEQLPAELQPLLEHYLAARSQKDWETADAIREQLLARHIQLEVTKEGVRWKRVSRRTA
jgi:cysteinyl-tRNA synthetase